MLLVQTFYGSSVTITLVSSLLFTIALLLTIKWLVSFIRMYMIARDIPGPTGYPIVGHMLSFGDPYVTFKFGQVVRPKYGKLFKLWIFHLLNFVMVDKIDVKFLLTNLKQSNRPYFLAEAMKIVVGKGMLTSRDGDSYKTHKRVVNPLFHTRLLKNYSLIFEEKIRRYCEMMEQVADGRTIDIYYYMSNYTLEAIYETIIGSGITKEGSDNEFVMALRNMENLIPICTVQPWIRMRYIQWFFADGRKFITNMKLIDSVLERIVTDKIQAARKAKHLESARPKVSEKPAGNGEDMEDVETKEIPTLLDMIFQECEEGIDKYKDIKDELWTFIGAGFETSATALSYLLVLLGMHQDIQEEVSRELVEVFGSSYHVATTEELNRLEVLDRVIKESLRLFPTAPVVPREVNEDTLLPSGKTLPAGSSVFVSLYHLHRDPDSYHDPDSFIPDRWRPECANSIHPDAFMPFGWGPRSCIGFRYAMLQLKVTACNVLRRFKVSTNLTMEDLKNVGISVTLLYDGRFEVQLQKKNLDSF